MRRQNNGLRKICDCARRTWAKCPHAWHFNFKWNGTAYRFSLDREVGRRLTTKDEAKTEADKMRAAIREGTFRKPEPAPVIVTTPEAITFDHYAGIFIKGFSKDLKRKTTWQDDEVRAGRIAAFVVPGTTERIGARAIGSITETDVIAFLTHLRDSGKRAGTFNHYLQLFKSMSKFGVKRGHLTRPWLTSDSDLKRQKPARRTRRLAEGEEAALIQAAPPRLQRIIIGALETGCRRGELLMLRLGDVDFDRRRVTIQGEHTKTSNTRVLPLSARLAAVLEMCRHDPAGNELPPSAFVFGNAMGEKQGSITKAWEAAILKAHGVPVAYVGKTHALAPECREALRRINLHFHDLRHEAGSRFLEAGFPVHHVKEMLGHADIKTTDTYLNVTQVGLQESMRRYDQSRPGCNPVAGEAIGDNRLPRNDTADGGSKSLVN